MREPIFRAGLLSLILATAVLSGCIGDSGKGKGPKEGESEEVESGPPAGEAQVSATTGAIDGIVVDEAFNPLPGAKATILDPPGGNSSLTDADGRFVFSDLAPGSYKIVAERLGYDSKAVSVAVTAGEVSKVTFNLDQLEVQGLATVDTFEEGGFIGCGTGIGGPEQTGGASFTACYTDDNVVTDHEFELESDVATMVFTLKWSATGGVVGSSLYFELLGVTEGCDTSTGRNCAFYGATEGASPLTMRLDGSTLQNASKEDQPIPANGTVPLLLRVFPYQGDVGQVSLYFQQPYKLYANVFHVDPAPEGFTGLPDE